MRYKSVIFLVILLFMSSCVSFNDVSINNIYKKCNTFVVKIQNVDGKNILFYSKLKASLEDELNLLVYNDNHDNIGTNKCILNVTDIKTTNYVPLTNNSGIASRNNSKIDVKYSVFVDNKIIKNSCIVFYGSNVSENYYSEYVNTAKMRDNDVALLTEKIFYSVINDINKIK